MNNDFKTRLLRKNIGSYKWDAMTKLNPNVGDDIVPLSVADMEFAMPPKIISGLKTYLNSASFGYSASPPSYAAAVIAWYKRRHQFEVERSWIINTGGVVSAFFTAVDVFSQPGEAVALMSPVYYPFFKAIEAKNRKLVDCPLVNKGLHYEMDLERFEALVVEHKVKLLLFCSPHNPVGRVWTRQELTALGDILIRHDVILVSDEIHCDIVMPGQIHTVFQTISDAIADRCLTMMAATKSFNLAGIGVSSIVIKNPALKARFIDQLWKNAASPHDTLPYVATQIAYNECEDWFDEMLAVVWANFCYLRDFMAKHVPQIKVFPLEGTYLAWLDCRDLGMAAPELEAFMTYKAQLFLVEGHKFGESGQGFERINLAAPHHTIVTALERLKLALLACPCTEKASKD